MRDNHFIQLRIVLLMFFLSGIFLAAIPVSAQICDFGEDNPENLARCNKAVVNACARATQSGRPYPASCGPQSALPLCEKTCVALNSLGFQTAEPFTRFRLEDMVSSIATFMISISVVVGIIYVVIAGISYLRSGSDQQRAESAKKQLKAVLTGVLIVLAIGVIIKTIQVILNRSFFDF